MSLTLVTHDVLKACRLARQFERRGEYRLAAEQLRFVWGGVGEYPQTAGLGRDEAGELLLRAGKLTGWLGGHSQVPGAQSLARDLLCEARRLLEDGAGIAECRNAIAVSYWREGDFDIAKMTAEEAFNESAPATEERVGLLNTIAMIDIQRGRLNTTKEFMKAHYDEVLQSQSPQEICNFHGQLGNVYRRLGEAELEQESRQELLGLALIEYDGARGLLEEIGNFSYKARTENNMALTLVAQGHPNLAHLYIKSAIEFAKSARDNSLLGSFEETRAQILLAEDNLRGALVAIKASLGYLRGGEQYALQAESETTHGVILMRMGDREGAEAAFAHAISLAETAQMNTGKIKLTRLCELMELHKAEALRYEKEWVQLALDETGGQPTDAARLVGIKHQSFIVKIKRFRLETARTPAKPRRKKNQS